MPIGTQQSRALILVGVAEWHRELMKTRMQLGVDIPSVWNGICIGTTDSVSTGQFSRSFCVIHCRWADTSFFLILFPSGLCPPLQTKKNPVASKK